jgi:hypothetical protein
LLGRKAIVGGTTKANKAHSPWPRTESQPLEERLVSAPEERCPSVDRQKTHANDKHDPWCNICKHRKNLEIKKPYAVSQYNKFIIYTVKL